MSINKHIYYVGIFSQRSLYCKNDKENEFRNTLDQTANNWTLYVTSRTLREIETLYDTIYYTISRINKNIEIFRYSSYIAYVLTFYTFLYYHNTIYNMRLVI